MTKCKALCWDVATTPLPLQIILQTLAEEYPIHQGLKKGALPVEFVPAAPAGTVEVLLRAGRARIAYDQPHHAVRGVGALLAGLVRTDLVYRETVPFQTFGIMLDCSRNAVMTVQHFKTWLRRLALLGYNMAMLYTEETYQLAGEDYFGYMRGRYTPEELRAVDAYAGRLGMEMIGCIQTLGHLEQMLKYPAFRAVKDTNSVLLVDEPKTYELIEKMLRTYAECFRSRRIHVGMDETHDLGRGRFLDLFGYQRGYDLFNRHLGKVVALCERQGLRPMIWSDMYFRMGNKQGGYYDLDMRIPDDVKAAIPAQAELVYWDYYHDNEEFYRAYIGKHRALGKEPVMGSGVWTWGTFWYGRQNTEKNAAPCVKACRDERVKEFFFTMWGDDGGYCEFDSALAGLAYGAELAYAGELVAGRLEQRFAALCGVDYKAVCLAAGLNGGHWNAPGVLWDDPLLGIYWNNRKANDKTFWPRALKQLRSLQAKLRRWSAHRQPVDLAHASTLVACMIAKIEFRMELDAAYAARGKVALTRAAAHAARAVRAVEALLESFRRQWYRRNKPQGFDTMQIRLAGLAQRYREAQTRLRDLSAGRIASIPELDEPLPAPGTGVSCNWRNLAAAGII